VEVSFEELVAFAAEKTASDIFLKQGTPPMLRVHGEIEPTPMPGLTGDDTRAVAEALMSERQKERFLDYHECDIGITIGDIVRLRVNISQERGAIAVVSRLIPLRVPTIDELVLPSILKELVKHKSGLILVTGPTGCGKSTTLAAMIAEINGTRPCNIVTIEDPLEYVHTDDRGIVMQREIGTDTQSFSDALKYVLRQSPDVILIGEMRDVETFSTAMAAAETGHLVFSTVHTRSAAETLDRIINMFPPNDKPQICLRLADTMKAALTQKLIPRADNLGRVCAMEIMVVTPTVAKLIEEGRPGEVYGQIAEGQFWGMQTMNQALYNYVKQGAITAEQALINAGNLTELRQMLRR
jgi:twitching motility protein PilT